MLCLSDMIQSFNLISSTDSTELFFFVRTQFCKKLTFPTFYFWRAICDTHIRRKLHYTSDDFYCNNSFSMQYPRDGLRIKKKNCNTPAMISHEDLESIEVKKFVFDSASWKFNVYIYIFFFYVEFAIHMMKSGKSVLVFWVSKTTIFIFRGTPSKPNCSWFFTLFY